MGSGVDPKVGADVGASLPAAGAGGVAKPAVPASPSVAEFGTAPDFTFKAAEVSGTCPSRAVLQAAHCLALSGTVTPHFGQFMEGTAAHPDVPIMFHEPGKGKP